MIILPHVPQLAAHDLKSAIDQGYVAAQSIHRFCPQNGQDVSRGLKGAAHYSEHAADEGIAAARCDYGTWLYDGGGPPIDVERVAYDFRLAAGQELAPEVVKGAVHYLELVANQELARG
jgi:TPR repeat protein